MMLRKETDKGRREGPLATVWNQFQFRYQTLFNLSIIRLSPQGTVDINLGPDRLAGPKALDANHCRQPILLSESPNCAC